MRRRNLPEKRHCDAGTLAMADARPTFCFICGATEGLMTIGGLTACADEDACAERMSHWRPTGFRGDQPAPRIITAREEPS